MTAPRRLSVGTSIRITLMGVLLSVTVAGIVLHDRLQRSDADAASHNATSLVAQTIVNQFNLASFESPEGLQQSCDRLVRDPTVLAVRCVEPATGQVVSAEAQKGLLSVLKNDEVKPVALAQAGTIHLRPVTIPGLQRTQVAVAQMGAGLGVNDPPTMALLLQVMTPLDNPFHRFWRFSIPMLAVGSLGLLIGSWWLRREVIHPIMSLVEKVASGPENKDGDILPDLATIASSLERLREDVGIWRDRAERIERRMDTQIAKETEKITRDLKRMQREAWRDPLTGINNRRLLKEKYPAIFASQREEGHDLSVVMIDLDNFKMLNDELGHAAGDGVLTLLGQLLKQCVRSEDIAIRYGGDEFILILPGVSAAEARQTMERISRMFVQRMRQLPKVKAHPTLSAGVASIWDNGPHEPIDLLKMADHALYQAKAAGRNCIQICSTFAYVVAREASKFQSADLSSL